jgi:hypothetical protein
MVLKLKTKIKASEHFSITLLIQYCERRVMDNNLIQLQNEEEREEGVSGIPICGANLSIPVIDVAKYIEEVYYKVGIRLYIENAD